MWLLQGSTANLPGLFLLMWSINFDFIEPAVMVYTSSRCSNTLERPFMNELQCFIKTLFTQTYILWCA